MRAMTSRPLLALALLATACAASDDLALPDEQAIALDDVTAPSLPLQIVEPRDEDDALNSDDCTLDEDDVDAVVATFAGASERTVGRRDAIDLIIENLRDAESNVRVHATVFSAAGSATMHDLANVDLGKGDHARVEIDVADLQLTTRQLQRSGHVTFTIEAKYDEGGAQQPMQAPIVYFHPNDDGTWALYDAKTRDEKYDGGALTQDAQRFARRAEHAGSTVLDAHVHPFVEPDLDDREGPPDSPHDVHEGHAAAAASTPTPKLVAPTDAAEGGTVDFCFRLETQYDDSGMGEDFWTSNTPIFRDARGIYARVERYTSAGWTEIFEDYTGDGIGAGDPGKGCTGDLVSTGPAFYRYTIWAKGEVQGNPVEAWDDFSIGLFSSWILRSYAIGGLDIVSGGQHQVDISTEVDERLNVLMMASYALYRHAGGLSGQRFKIRVDDETRYDSASDTIYISDGSSDEKFKGLHEVGHAIGDITSDGMITGSNYSIADGTCPATADSPTSTSNHSLLSLEFSEAAANEGFAHFYSADVFNDDDETDCWFGYYKTEFGISKPIPINCEVSNTISGNTFSTRFMETNCTGNFNGRGVELDWLRAFWDVHTNGSNPPHFNTILDWLDTADEPGQTTVYDELDDAADDIGGSLHTNWNAAVSFNGIDW